MIPKISMAITGPTKQTRSHWPVLSMSKNMVPGQVISRRVGIHAYILETGDTG